MLLFSMHACPRHAARCRCRLPPRAGVGISGQEGMQAAMSADFAIAQFRFLVPLLLVHGRYSYKRITRMVLFFFYKNMLFGVSIFAFNAFNAFSGQFIYNDFYMTLFNVVFTALTPIVIGIFDRDVDKEMGLKYPGLYLQGACVRCSVCGLATAPPVNAIMLQQVELLPPHAHAARAGHVGLAHAEAAATHMLLQATHSTYDIGRCRSTLLDAYQVSTQSVQPQKPTLPPLSVRPITPIEPPPPVLRTPAGQRNEYFNFRAIALWLISSLYQCAVLMVFVLVGCPATASDRAGGQAYTMWQTGVLMFSAIVITVHVQVGERGGEAGRGAGAPAGEWRKWGGTPVVAAA